MGKRLDFRGCEARHRDSAVLGPRVPLDRGPTQEDIIRGGLQAALREALKLKNPECNNALSQLAGLMSIEQPKVKDRESMLAYIRAISEGIKTLSCGSGSAKDKVLEITANLNKTNLSLKNS